MACLKSAEYKGILASEICYMAHIIFLSKIITHISSSQGLIRKKSDLASSNVLGRGRRGQLFYTGWVEVQDFFAAAMLVHGIHITEFFWAPPREGKVAWCVLRTPLVIFLQEYWDQACGNTAWLRRWSQDFISATVCLWGESRLACEREGRWISESDKVKVNFNFSNNTEANEGSFCLGKEVTVSQWSCDYPVLVWWVV